MSKSMRNMLVLVAVQSAQGTAATPTAVANAFLARSVSPNPTNSEFAERDLIRGYFGNSGKVQVKESSSIDFEIEIAGAGAPGTVPKYGAALRACAFSETITPGVDVVYAPTTPASEWVTIWCFVDGILFEMQDCQGNVSGTLNAQQIPVYRFSFEGAVANITDTPNPTDPDFSAWQPPLGVNNKNTPDYTIDGVEVCATAFDFDMGNQVIIRDIINCATSRIVDRTPTGNTTFELTDIATKNWYEQSRLGTTSPFSIVHGTEAGNIVEISGPAVQVISPDLTDDDSIAMLQCGLEFQPVNGNDELIITVR